MTRICEYCGAEIDENKYEKHAFSRKCQIEHDRKLIEREGLVKCSYAAKYLRDAGLIVYQLYTPNGKAWFCKDIVLSEYRAWRNWNTPKKAAEIVYEEWYSGMLH